MSSWEAFGLVRSFYQDRNAIEELVPVRDLTDAQAARVVDVFTPRLEFVRDADSSLRRWVGNPDAACRVKVVQMLAGGRLEACLKPGNFLAAVARKGVDTRAMSLAVGFALGLTDQQLP